MTDTVKVVYVGPFEAVDVEHQVDRPWAGTAYRGTPIDVPAHVADGLLEQPSNWQPAPTAAPKVQPTTSTPDPVTGTDERSDQQ